jgi:putative oxidoreductase
MKADIGLLALRIYGGLYMLLAHGWSKMLTLFGGAPIQFADVFGMGQTLSLGLAVFAEVLCALFVLLGIATRWAAFPLAITMAVATFVIHAADPWSRKELAIGYLCVYIALMCLGGGRLGLDNFVKRAKN